MPESEQKNTLEVHSAESGQKLLQFLMRRLDLPQALLHRWIRTGQVRINGGRGKPFVHVHTGDKVRIPPFALSMNQSATFETSPSQTFAAENFFAEKSLTEESLTLAPAKAPWQSTKDTAHPAAKQHIAPHSAPLPPAVYVDEHIIIYNKPSGLPVHGGTGHSDSLAQRLEDHFSHLPFKPTPAHRLDKDTSGLICVALSYAALRTLQEAFAGRSMTKEYVAVVYGSWPHDGVQELKHSMAKKFHGTQEKMHTLQDKEAEDGKEAISIVRCIARSKKYSLMQVRLITGRTHQIRVQLAAQGHPIVGDTKYGKWQSTLYKLKSFKGIKLCLHSMRITFPQNLALPYPNEQEEAHMPSMGFCPASLAGQSFSVLPTWEKPFTMEELPPSLTDSNISR